MKWLFTTAIWILAITLIVAFLHVFGYHDEEGSNDEQEQSDL